MVGSDILTTLHYCSLCATGTKPLAKVCTKCGVDKRSSMYGLRKVKSCSNRHHKAMCKACCTIYNNKRTENIRETNPEKYEAEKLYHTEYVKQHRTGTGARARINESYRRYMSRRFFFVRAVKKEYEASHHDLAKLWKSQKGKCALTGRKLDRSAHLDHIVPKSCGGTNGLENLRWVCKDANFAKRSLLDADFVQLCKDVVKTMESKT